MRFFRFSQYVTFLSDQGRDAIILKRLITLEHLPAIGPPTSIGQVYLGPFYYYFIAPWLFLFRFNPVGPAFGVAFFSTLFIIFYYLIIKEIINKKVALISSILITFSQVLVSLSRFSWNPNLLPFFSFFVVYFLIKAVEKQRWYFYFLLGAFLSFSVQLHYLALFLFLPTVVFLLLKDYQKISFFKKLKKYLICFFGFFIFSIPLLIFDLRHNFLNSKNFLKMFENHSSTFILKINNIFESFYYLNLYSLSVSLNKFLVYLLLILIVLSFITLLKTKNKINYFLGFFILIIIQMYFYNGPKHPHYFAFIYIFYYLIISYFLANLNKNWLEKTLTLIFIFAFIILNLSKMPYFFYRGADQIAHSKKVALFLKEKIDNKPFNIATWPDEFGEDNYLYFLELEGLKPANRQKVEITDQMFVLCAKEPCLIENSPSWNIAMFGQAKIDKIWSIEGLKIYKLVHPK